MKNDLGARATLPEHLILEVTRKCNFHCPFCYCVWHEFPELARRDLSAREWKRILDFVLANGVNDLLFTGGEALMRRDIRDLIAYARSLAPGCRLAVFTNGARMNEDFIKFFRRHKVHISSSLPGLSTYSEMTGSRRGFTRVLAMIARAKELKWPVCVSLTATSVNYHEFADMFCAAAIAGAADIQVGAAMLAGQARLHPELTISRNDWEILKQRIRELPDFKVSYNFCDEMLCECREQRPEDLAAFGQCEHRPCQAGHRFGVIGPSGYFRNCMHTVENRIHWRELASGRSLP